MSNIEDHDENRDYENKSISISKLTPAAVQAIYKEMLDTSESLAKIFAPGKIVHREDIKNFCERFEQTSRQYNLKGIKTEFLIRREEDNTERFTSLDRFLASDSGGGRLTSGVSVEFSFLIQIPSIEKYQEYKTILNIDSSDFTDVPEGERFLKNMIQFPSFSFNIDYSDYSVARTFIAMTEDWHKSLKNVKTSPILDFIKRKINPFSDVSIITNIVTFVITALSIYSCLRLTRVWPIGETNGELINYLCVCALIIFTSRFSSILLTGILFRNISSYRIPNFVILNNKDIENFSSFTNRKKSIILTIFFVLAGFMITITLNIISAWAYNKFW